MGTVWIFLAGLSKKQNGKTPGHPLGLLCPLGDGLSCHFQRIIFAHKYTRICVV